MSDMYISFLKFIDREKMTGTPIKRASMNAYTLRQILNSVCIPGDMALTPVKSICGVEVVVDRRLSDGGFRNETEQIPEQALLLCEEGSERIAIRRFLLKCTDSWRPYRNEYIEGVEFSNGSVALNPPDSSYYSNIGPFSTIEDMQASMSDRYDHDENPHLTLDIQWIDEKEGTI